MAKKINHEIRNKRIRVSQNGGIPVGSDFSSEDLSDSDAQYLKIASRNPSVEFHGNDPDINRRCKIFNILNQKFNLFSRNHAITLAKSVARTRLDLVISIVEQIDAEKTAEEFSNNYFISKKGAESLLRSWIEILIRDKDS